MHTLSCWIVHESSRRRHWVGHGAPSTSAAVAAIATVAAATLAAALAADCRVSAASECMQ